MKIKREDFEEAFDWISDFENEMLEIEESLNNLGIEIKDPEPEVVWEGTNDIGTPHRLLSDGILQMRTQEGRKWLGYETFPSLARDIQRKDEALRRIESFPCGRERTGGFDCGKCPACLAHQALEGES